MDALGFQTILPWHQSLWPQLWRLMQLSGGVALVGPRGHGKHWLARRMAMALLCEKIKESFHPCGQCHGCQLFLSGQHPDYIEIFPENRIDNFSALRQEETKSSNDKTQKLSQEIRIKDIRALNRISHLSAHRGGRRVVLIWPADTMNLEASNALLKLLEESNTGFCFILVVSHVHKLLPTVRSRVRVLPCSPAKFNQGVQWLNNQGVRKAEQALSIAVEAPLDVLGWGEDDEALKLRETCLQWLLRLAKDGASSRPITLDHLGLTNIYQMCLLLGYEIIRHQTGEGLRYLDLYIVEIKKLRLQNSIILHQFLADTFKALAYSEHPLNIKIQLDNLALRWRMCFI